MITRNLQFLFFAAAHYGFTTVALSAPSSTAYALIEASKDCNRLLPSTAYSACVNEQLPRVKRTITKTLTGKIKTFTQSKKSRITQNIDKRTKANELTCSREKKRFGKSANAENRFSACLFENQIELLILIESNLKQFE